MNRLSAKSSTSNRAAPAATMSTRFGLAIDIGALDAWAHQGAAPEASAARYELVRLLMSAAMHPSSELNLVKCDAQACVDLPDDLVKACGELCTSQDPPTSRLILPPGLPSVPAWVTRFGALTQLVAHGFTGGIDEALRRLEEQCPDLMCDFGTVDVQATPAPTTLRSIYRPYVGELSDGAKAGLKRFMDEVRGVVRIDKANGSDYDVGGFKVVRSPHGGLELSKLAVPPYRDPDLKADDREAKDLPKAIEVFNTYSDDVRTTVWEAMKKCGYVGYLTDHAKDLVDGAWDVLININPFFSRKLSQNTAHRDTEGENMFIMLFHCSDRALMGMEYQLHPQNPPAYQHIMRNQLPSVFVDEVERILDEAKDQATGKAYAPTVGPWGFVAGCDETMVHLTPFPHHRGALLLASVVESMGAALQTVDADAAEEYSTRSQRRYRGDQPPSDLVQRVRHVVDHLQRLALSDTCIDRDALQKLIRDAGLESSDANRLFDALASMGTTVDPFDGKAVINIPSLGYLDQIKVPRGKDLQREMSEKLDAGTVHRHVYPETRDYLRVWVMARMKDDDASADESDDDDE